MRVKYLAIAAPALVALAVMLPTHTASGLETFTFRETKNFEIGAMPDVSLETISGDVSYDGVEGTSASLEIVIEVSADDSAEAVEIREKLKLIVEGEEGRLSARMDDSREFFRWLNKAYRRNRQVDVSFYAKGPKDAEAMLSSVSGDVRADDILGTLEAESVSGDVKATDLEGRVRVSSVSGNVDVRRCAGPIVVNTVSGEIELSECGADLTVESVSGNIVGYALVGPVVGETVSGDADLRGVKSSVTFETVSGNITLEQDKGGFDLSTTSGDVTVHSGGDGDMEIGSVGGDVTIAVDPAGVGEVILESPGGEMDVDAPVRLRSQGRDRVAGRLGDGTATLRVHTSSGDIILSEL